MDDSEISDILTRSSNKWLVDNEDFSATQKQISQVGISNCIPQNTVECNHFSIPEIPASGTEVLIFVFILYCRNIVEILRDCLCAHMSISPSEIVANKDIYTRLMMTQMEAFSALLVICSGNSPVPVNSPHKGQWRGALMFSLMCTRINSWINNGEAGDLRRHRAHYDVTVMFVVVVLLWLYEQPLTIHATYSPISSIGLLYWHWGNRIRLNIATLYNTWYHVMLAITSPLVATEHVAFFSIQQILFEQPCILETWNIPRKVSLH